MIQAFINYAFIRGDVVGQPVKLVERLYKIYCKLFKVEEVDHIVNRICNEYNLYIEKGCFNK